MGKLVKYSLPRHTILAKQSSRIGAAVVDFAFALVFFFAFYFGCFNIVFSKTTTNAYMSQLSTWQLKSHLVYFDEETQETKIYSSNEDYLVYDTPVKYYYLNYLTGKDIENKERDAAPNYNVEFELEDKTMVLPANYYTVSWYNYNILGINNDNPDSETSSTFFTYVKDSEGNYDKNQFGVPKTKRFDKDKNALVEITKTDLAVYYKEQYIAAYNHLAVQPFYMQLQTKLNFINSLSLMLAILSAGLVNYVIIPYFMKQGATLGKKIFKLGLANIAGYQFKKVMLLPRFIPFLLTVVAACLIPATTFYFSFIVVAVVFLSSFGVMMASPKKCSLHDYTGQTIVIDTKASIIFDDSLLEEQYVMKEDDVEIDELVEGGEEPEISYEK